MMWRNASSGRPSQLRDKMYFLSSSFLFSFYVGLLSFQCNASQSKRLPVVSPKCINFLI